MNTSWTNYLYASRSQLHNDDIFKWDVALIVLNRDSLYYGGYFKATMSFPSNYPYAPPRKLPTVAR